MLPISIHQENRADGRRNLSINRVAQVGQHISEGRAIGNHFQGLFFDRKRQSNCIFVSVRRIPMIMIRRPGV